MLQRFLRSPFVPMTMYLVLIAFLFMSQVDWPDDQRWVARRLLLLMSLLVIVWSVLVGIHNRKYPEQRIKYWGMIPPEFREVDEGQQWVTFKACRNVYIYYTIALPVVALVCVLFSKNPLAVICALGGLGLGQYIVYWLTIRRLNMV